MPRKAISIRVDKIDLDWLDRNGKKRRSRQMRDDLLELRRLRHIAESQPHMPISEAVDIANLRGEFLTR